MLKLNYSCLTDAEDHFEDEPVQPPSGKSNGGKNEEILDRNFVNQTFREFYAVSWRKNGDKLNVQISKKTYFLTPEKYHTRLNDGQNNKI